MKKKLKRELATLIEWHDEQAKMARALEATLMWPGSIAAHKERAEHHEAAAAAIRKAVE